MESNQAFIENCFQFWFKKIFTVFKKMVFRTKVVTFRSKLVIILFIVEKFHTWNTLSTVPSVSE